MTQPQTIEIKLTAGQREKLAKHFEYVSAEARRGYRGMLLAQIYGPYMRVGFVEHERAKRIKSASR